MAALAEDDGARRELARGTVELAILAVLRMKPRYGYELLTVLADATGGAPDVREGTLYPALHRMEDAGYVTASWEAEGRAKPRKYYSLTKAGRARLGELSAEWRRLATGIDRLLSGG